MLVHKHLIIRAEINNPPRDPEWSIEWLRSLAGKIGMKVCMGPISSYVDVPGNRGLTSVVVIETSHMAVLVWDEESPGLIQMDVYTCGPLDTSIIFKELEQFNPVKIEYKYLDREHGLIEIPVNQ
jgi:S-adenosylmethionine/arginine decarboxylase-like enzyme